MMMPPFHLKLKDHAEDGLMATVPWVPKVIASRPGTRIVPADPPIDVLRQAQNDVVRKQIID
jgi:hypothetical protein